MESNTLMKIEESNLVEYCIFSLGCNDVWSLPNVSTTNYQRSKFKIKERWKSTLSDNSPFF